ncbi:putative 2'-O-ribosyl phosphate transferase RIT1 [Metarhizium acridum CQMa 102]|uniref:Putative 2'-O-ribosyl phosphate transferase RIT1 n=1 Tax=Metarhizium acridum (strain CQMa 102) TaxID=655827 RepID=E9EIX2_METAQ|nr:putative 2'-O-ribosyl phosphate transferase RIT1 [Metarhizium acridum CQMa 102]EFY84136.1 putative 2'-O-ribosyl phosphate transferase RIT1 [Metarhizium acridum CQMa 102]
MTTPNTINVNDIVFPSQPSLSTLLTSLKRSTLSIHNRLTSILSDAEFVHQAAQALRQPPSNNEANQETQERVPRPLIANERCGSWYIPPGDKYASAYFKSTDGHERAWKFSTRRLNLHLLDMIEKHDGIIIVDSTRRGKRMPDALSTTVPIWCTVLNTILLPSHPLSSQLFLPPHLLPTTHAQITALFPQFVASFKALNLQDLPKIAKPLRPFWVTQDSVLGPHLEAQDQTPGTIYASYRPVICLTASRRNTSTSEIDSNGYIQGAADDTENWARGLTPALFWANRDLLLSTPEPELPGLIASLVRTAPAIAADNPTTQLTPQISVCALPLPPSTGCCISLTNAPTPKDGWAKSATSMDVGLGKHKTASRNLRTALPHICDFASACLQRDPQGMVTVACESGKDTSVGAALALSCYLFDDEGQFRVPDETARFTKTLVKMRLGRIMTVYPEANPSRQTLQSVNSFLMDWAK